ncbi:MAG: hypothetical protein C1942_08540 [Prosthecochloris sp.]|uniref:AAA family ATPase n=1 Tax=Prosthecochloris sp. TaxID=290513 RepID=UPI0013CDB001|nr:AAA family ATPase [Prosthecochloris sp.]NEX12716.1 hypothetical protein [Prosthecochloris sp.]
MPEKYIITGGPGAGKSTLLRALQERGYRTYEEVSRRIIREQAALEGGILPWENLEAFAEVALHEMLQQHDDAAARAEICFFDRGVPDVFGYLHNSGIPVSSRYMELYAACCYQKTVFILPPWPDIFIQDSERPQSFGESEALYHSLADVYRSLGFRLVELGTTSVEERVRAVVSLTG